MKTLKEIANALSDCTPYGRAKKEEIEVLKAEIKRLALCQSKLTRYGLPMDNVQRLGFTVPFSFSTLIELERGPLGIKAAWEIEINLLMNTIKTDELIESILREAKKEFPKGQSIWK